LAGKPDCSRRLCPRRIGAGLARSLTDAQRPSYPSLRSRQPVCLDQIHSAPRRSWHRTVGRQRRRQLRQRLGRDDQWPIQGRGHPSAWPVTQLRGCRICDPRLGRLVQPSATTLTHLQHPTRRSRSTMLCCHQRNGFGSVTLKHQPPANPKRFTSGALARTIAWRILGAIEATAGVMLLVRLPAFFDVVVGRSRCPLHVMPTRA
jgi:hypothetical protein